MKLGFLYGGQGCQKKSMGLDFYENNKIAKDYYNSIKIKKDILNLSFNGSEEEIKKTENTQVILIAYETMITKLLEINNIHPNAVAGLSIGEFAALNAGKIITSMEAMKIAEFRGEKMSLASLNINPAMYAIIGIEEEILEKICEESSNEKSKVFISNLNTKNQIVISGDKIATEKAVLNIKKLGKKAIKLNVSGAFHTPYMNTVYNYLLNYFKNINFKQSPIDVYFNYTGDKNPKENLKTLMAKQVKSKVRFEDTIKNMLKDNVDTFLEIGYGNVISGFIKKINPNVKVYSISNYKSYLDFLRSYNG